MGHYDRCLTLNRYELILIREEQPVMGRSTRTDGSSLALLEKGGVRASWLLIAFLGVGGAWPAVADVSGCGLLVQGVECVLFQADAGGLYLLDNYAGFQAGDRVCLTGVPIPQCVSVCQQGNGCIEVASIKAPFDAVATPTSYVCGGDCNASGEVTVDEVMTAVTIALGMASLQACPAADGDETGTVEVPDIIKAVNAVLNGCPSG